MRTAVASDEPERPVVPWASWPLIEAAQTIQVRWPADEAEDIAWDRTAAVASRPAWLAGLT